jgi:hypothetical protein
MKSNADNLINSAYDKIDEAYNLLCEAFTEQGIGEYKKDFVGMLHVIAAELIGIKDRIGKH